MLKGRSRDPRGSTPAHLHAALQPSTLPHATRPAASSLQRTPAAPRPEPDYEVVEFPGEQYVNANLQPPPPPPPRPPTGHPLEAGASCGLCGGGGARVRCAECGRRALCASCDDMYHRHPKRRNHQRQALSKSQLLDERPPLPPKVAPPVPPPRRHKIGSDGIIPKSPMLDQKRAPLNHISTMMGSHTQNLAAPSPNHQATQQHMHQPIPVHLQTKITSTPTSNHVGSVPFLPTNMHLAAAQSPGQVNTLSHVGWNRPRGSQQGFGLHPNTAVQEPWDNSGNMNPAMQNWYRPLRRGASVLELSGGAASTCVGCAHCAPTPWRYGSCASLDHPWATPNPGWPSACCTPPHVGHNVHMHQHPHMPPPQTPQPYRRGDNRTVSRAASRAGSRAVSPAMSIRSRTSRRHKHRTPSPPVPSSDADSESESESDHGIPVKSQEKEEDSLGPAPPPPTSTWQCEHCTFVNEPGVRVCVICCRTPTNIAKPIINTQSVGENIERLKINSRQAPSPAIVKLETNVERDKAKTKKERTSTGCGPSPPKENNLKISVNRLVTPTREMNVNNESNSFTKHDIAVGPSPPRDIQNVTQRPNRQDTSTEIVPLQDSNTALNDSPYKGTTDLPRPETPKRHNISVGPSPPRESSTRTSVDNSQATVPKKSTGTSPPRDPNINGRFAVTISKSAVSNTGTSPPPQSISTQTYEVPNTWEQAPSVSRSRPRRRFRDDNRRERSHSRHSLSSDTRESERSIRTAGPENRWEWRERDSSPGGDWADGYSRLSRRASHLDLRRTRSIRRSSFYGSEAPSPERQSGRAISLEALAGAGAKREAERGIELAQLMGEAEKLGFSAAEVQAALIQSPAAPLSWLRERWPSLCAGVRAAAVRLAPTAAITELEARAALARHRGAMWPAVTECVERHRRQVEISGVGEERRLRGHVWGSPVGADDDAAPPRSPSRHSHRMRAEDSSDECEAPTLFKLQDDDWMYLPLNIKTADYEREEYHLENNITEKNTNKKDDLPNKLKILLQEAGVSLIDENLLLKGLLSGNSIPEPTANIKPQSIDFIQSENDFIDAYNALTRLSPLPNINDSIDKASTGSIKSETNLHVPNGTIILNNSEMTSSTGGNHNKTKSLTKKVNSNSPMKRSLLNSENNGNTKQTPSPEHPIETREAHMQRQTEENTKNLSDMVDNTQKLIQKMKEEINSDINSIDGGPGARSEIEISSEESNDEQESSYSDTDERTDNPTSDEKEITSSEEEHEENSKIKIIDMQIKTQHRTSSEDNETFEEALDHVEDQLEDFKLANMEILDSITRTLQEEHTFTIEKSEQTFAMTPKKQDLNNNVFVPVNSFDEIYEELSNNKNELIQRLETLPTVKSVTEPKLIDLLTKETMINVEIKSVIPTKVLISETKQLISNGKLEHIDNDSISNEEISTQAKVNEITENGVSHVNSIAHSSKQTNLIAHKQNIADHNESNFTQVLEKNVEHSTLFVNMSSNLEQTEFNVHTADILITTHQPDSYKEDELDNSENKKQNTIPEDTMEGVDLGASNINNDKDTMVSESGSINTENGQTTGKVITNKFNDININNKNHAPLSSVNTAKLHTKSGIPKLVKIMPNNKNKIDNHSPKFVISKVPIRRASLKQYPAPAPPRNHFGNVQSGYVKQLQTKLFNSKTTSSNHVPTSSELVEVKATTSTLNKKKPAPPPPVKQEEKEESSLPTTLPPSKEKKQYFRETCRTEDEWTDSDSEDSQLQIIKPREESPQSPPSPPPPLTLRRVSGQLIDLAKIRILEGSPERQARRLLAEGALETWEQAQLAVELVSRGTDAPAALLAALECTDLNSALAYLFQDCELCASRLPEHEMVSMLRCTHRCCRECARIYFTVQITERSIVDCVCPYCKLPELESLPEDAWLEYFAHLDILLKTLLEIEVHELFQRKLRDRTLARDPNFRWCVECSSGFFVHPKQKKVRCPECRSVSCATCRKPWNANHEGLTCEQYTAWLEDNDPERSVTAIQQHLRDNGLECPRCHFKYSLSRGGCMHFTCTQCKYEFCYGCGKPFTMGARCGLSDYCAKLGLHAHHPRNCLFYLRDKEPHELQTLLQMNNVNYETKPTEGGSGRCLVQLQRETPTGLVDGTCGNEAPANYAGLCKGHYVEYLAGLARGLDPIPIMDVAELVAELRRRALPLPERGPWDTDPIYAGMCAEIVREKIPLD